MMMAMLRQSSILGIEPQIIEPMRIMCLVIWVVNYRLQPRYFVRLIVCNCASCHQRGRIDSAASPTYNYFQMPSPKLRAISKYRTYLCSQFRYLGNQTMSELATTKLEITSTEDSAVVTPNLTTLKLTAITQTKATSKIIKIREDEPLKR
jgi:hypothetical protein